MKSAWIKPDWPAPSSIEAWVTTRANGVSAAPWDSLNLGPHVGDLDSHVRRNRDLLRKQLPGGTKLQWLNQVHGTRVVRVEPGKSSLRRKTADAVAVFDTGTAAIVMTADCLPVFLCDVDGKVAAAAHAGWRGLLDGVLENTVKALDVPAQQLIAWMGPAIASCHFQVGDDVRTAFLEHPSACTSQSSLFESAFVPCVGEAGKWMMDIYMVASLRLQSAGVSGVYGGGLCTVCDSARFFSYRRDGVTGRMAGLIYRKY
jgi:polyphenol oxidase